MTDLEVLSRAVVLSRSDYEFGSEPGKCTLPPGAVWPADNSECSNGLWLWLLPTLTVDRCCEQRATLRRSRA